MQNDTVNQWIDAGELRLLAESLLQPVSNGSAVAPEEIYGDHFVGYTDAGPVDPRESSSQGRARDVAMRSLSEARGKAAQAGLVTSPESSTPEPTASSAPAVEYSQAPEPVTETVTTRAAEELAATHYESAPPQVAQAPPAAPSPQPESPFRLTQDPPPQPPQQAQVQQVVTPTPVATGGQPQASSAPAPESIPTASSPSGQPLARRMEAFGGWLKQSVPAEAFFVCDRNGEIISDEIGNPKLIQVARTLAHAASSAGRQVGDAGGLSSPFVKIGVDRVLQVIPKRSKFGLVVLGVIVPQALGREAVLVIAQSLSKTLGDEVSMSV